MGITVPHGNGQNTEEKRKTADPNEHEQNQETKERKNTRKHMAKMTMPRTVERPLRCGHLLGNWIPHPARQAQHSRLFGQIQLPWCQGLKHGKLAMTLKSSRLALLGTWT